MGAAKRNIQQQKGFTIVELLIVIVVIGILAAIVIVAYNGVTKNARTSLIKSDLSGAITKLQQYRATSTDDMYPSNLDAADVQASSGTTYQYTYTSSDNTFCLSATNGGIDYYASSSNQTALSGVCTGHTASSSNLPAGYETAPVVSGGSTSFDGYNAVQPSTTTCPANGGSWIKVPGNSLYNKPNGFCVQQYAAVNVSGVPTSQNTGNKWTAITLPDAVTASASIASNTHLLSEDEWMTIATNITAQPQNWSGGAVGSGSLINGTGSSTASHGGVSFVLSNGQRIYFDTSSSSYYAGVEWTCYTGTAANNCMIAAKDEPAPGTAKYTYTLNTMTSFGSFATKNGYYYGDPRYANSALTSYVTSSNLNGMGYLYTTYAANSPTLYGFSRGYWRGANYGGLYTLYLNTAASYAHANYGFRAAAG